MNKILSALKWFSDGLTFQFGYELDWVYFSLGLSYNRAYSYEDTFEAPGMPTLLHCATSRLSLHLGPIELFVEGK